MKVRVIAFATLVLVAAIALQPANADGVRKHHGMPECEPGYKIVEEVVIHEVTRAICKMVPETKKKWVYSTIDAPYCVQDTRPGECPHCSGPYSRKLLVKRQIDEPCQTLKCVTELITEKIPVTIYRKVPCTEVPIVQPKATTAPGKK